MARKSPAKRIERLESICVGAGFLLANLRAEYGARFSMGTSQQVDQCINDCNQIARARSQREAATNTKESQA